MQRTTVGFENHLCLLFLFIQRGRVSQSRDLGSLPPEAGITGGVMDPPSNYLNSGDPHSGPHDSEASALTTEISAQPLILGI